MNSPSNPTTLRVKLTRQSGNAKTGPIPVSLTEARSCPPSCPLRGRGCYGEHGPLAIHWNRMGSQEDMSWPDFCRTVATLPKNQLWRHNQAGDLPGEGELISAEDLNALVEANQGKRGYTFTHKTSPENHGIIRQANDRGFAVNLSANHLEHADELLATKAGPVVTILPYYQLRNTKTPAGNRVVVCPAAARDDVTCQDCGLCARTQRQYVIGFPAHGARTKMVSTMAKVGLQPLGPQEDLDLQPLTSIDDAMSDMYEDMQWVRVGEMV